MSLQAVQRDDDNRTSKKASTAKKAMLGAGRRMQGLRGKAKLSSSRPGQARRPGVLLAGMLAGDKNLLLNNPDFLSGEEQHCQMLLRSDVSGAVRAEHAPQLGMDDNP